MLIFCFLKEETLYMDRDSQIKAIEKTFEDNKKPIEKHYSKPNVVPVEILNIFPDFKVRFYLKFNSKVHTYLYYWHLVILLLFYQYNFLSFFLLI